MKFLNEYRGVNNITPLEIAARALVIFLVALIMIRAAGMRPFGKDNTFNTVIMFLIGGILSSGVVGATPFFSAIAGALVILLVHKLLSKLSFYNGWVEQNTKGHSMLLYQNGSFSRTNMRKANSTEKDIFEELRFETQLNALETIAAVYIERAGKISFVKKAH